MTHASHLRARLRPSGELALRNTLAHGGCRGDSTSDSHEERVDELSTRPLLVGEDVAIDVTLAALDELDAGEMREVFCQYEASNKEVRGWIALGLHALFGECSGEEVRDVGVRMKTSKGDELPDET